ncbi:ribosome biogenesis GTPase Der [Leucothrix pacifica]|uniref:GTPase Der n=1 Tax=Leucothrix pacifica TaxID=1247513 RepID=A0A317C604_9GAMM|nr:ribosome biogenesis GTPase Der [Leucothrix pacifica]PWQ94066.1 ribosome biogenesis GTPase Der [Leucothrix pacifica]
MRPVIALVGRPNVGKSTLFNRVTKSRDALVADFPGLTRDRKYGTGVIGERDYLIIDTGGLSGDDAGIDEYMAKQTWLAVDEASIVLFLVDGKQGLTAADEMVANRLRREGKVVYLAVNKTDAVDPDQALSEFYGLGFAGMFAIAATQGRGVTQMMNLILDEAPEGEAEELPDEDDDSIRIAFIGRPNVGKSTLINRIMGEERVVAYDKPGTTRDSIFIPFERDEQKYTLIDTAGIRRRGKINEAVEKFSIVKTLQAIESAHVVIMLLDAQETITDQDAHLLGMILDTGRALVVAINKWDGLDAYQREQIETKLDLKLPFIDFADKHFISALHGTGVGHLYQSVLDAHASSMIKVSTPRLTRMLETALAEHQPPLVNGFRIKLRYAHQGGNNPFIVIIHGNQTSKIPGSYKRYLMNYFRITLKLKGTQVRLIFKTSDNPFEGNTKKRNALSPSQQYRLDKKGPVYKKKKGK